MRKDFHSYWDSVREWERKNPGYDSLEKIRKIRCHRRASDVARMYRDYWLLARDEWYITNKAGIGKDETRRSRLEGLWTGYYVPAIEASLRNNRILLDVLCESLNPASDLGKTYAAQLQDFKRVIEGFPTALAGRDVKSYCADYKLLFAVGDVHAGMLEDEKDPKCRRTIPDATQ
jgi:hypothetical protein